jgi:thermosome
MTDQNVQPIFILPEDTKRTSGKDAQRNNIAAAKAVAETVRTTLGPKGMDKMLVDSMNETVVTNDGVTILDEMAIEHPTAKMIVEVAKTQEDEVGDGTTTAVILAGELLKNAEDLLDKNIHPTIVTKGYRLAAERTQELLEKLGEDVDVKDEALLKKIGMTAMTGKGAETAKEKLSELCVKAVKRVVDKDNNVDLEDIKLEKKVGEGIENSELIEGIVLDKEKVHVGMPSKIEKVKVALLDVALEIKSTEMDAKISIDDPSKLQGFLDQEETMLKDMVNKVIESGANVLVCQKGIDDVAQYLLSENNIYAVRRVKESDMERLAKATGGKVVSNLSALDKSKLGSAGKVEEIKVGEDDMTYISGCENPKAVTLLIKGGTQHVVDEVERAVTDALGDVVAALKTGKVVGGAGAVEMELSRGIKEYANSLSGREQLAVLAFGEAMEVVPRTLAENAGLDPIDMLTELKASHDSGKKWAGIDVFKGEVQDAWENGIIEPLKIKTQAVKSASEVAELILRIDDVIAGSTSKESAMPPGGMGGMPPGMM